MDTSNQLANGSFGIIRKGRKFEQILLGFEIKKFMDFLQKYKSNPNKFYSLNLQN